MRAFAPVLALLAAAQLAHAGLVIVQEADQLTPVGGKTQMTVRIEGERARVDVGNEFSSIVDLSRGTVTSLIHTQKMAMELPRVTLDAVKTAAAKTEKPNLKPTGKRETINGYPCEEYVGTFQGLGLTYWLTSAVPNQKEILAQLGRLSGGADPFKAALAGGGDLPGFPIRTTVKSADHGNSTMTVLSIKETTIPDDVFAVPAGYRSMEVPAPPGP